MNQLEIIAVRIKSFWARRISRPLIGVLLVAFFVAFGSVGSFSKSVSNQEFFSYHVGDIVRKFFGSSTEMMMASQDFVYEDHLDGPLYGVAEGRNLIVIQVESFQNFLIGRDYNGVEITPNLNALIEDNSIYFDNYFMQVAMGNTSDAEFATNNSLYGTIEYCTYSRYEDNYFRGLPVLLAEQGYDVAAFHGYKKDFWNRDGAYPSLGFHKFYSEEDFKFEEVLGFGIRDDEFFEQSLDYMEELSQPFYSFLVTLSNHHPFPIPEDADYIKPLRQDQGTLFHDYINCAHFTDRCLGEFIDSLKERGLYENSVIAIYGDHMGLTAGDAENKKTMTNFMGKDYDVDTMANVPLIIHIPGAEEVTQTISISGGQLDFLPTIAYLMGFEKLETLYLGRNLLAVDSGFVAQYTYFPKGSFIRDDVIYVMGTDGVFKNGRAWNMVTGESVGLSQLREDSDKAAALVNLSEYYLKSDQIGVLMGELKQPIIRDKERERDPEEEHPEGIGITDAPEEATTVPPVVKPIVPPVLLDEDEEEDFDKESGADGSGAQYPGFGEGEGGWEPGEGEEWPPGTENPWGEGPFGEEGPAGSGEDPWGEGEDRDPGVEPGESGPQNGENPEEPGGNISGGDGEDPYGGDLSSGEGEGQGQTSDWQPETADPGQEGYGANADVPGWLNDIEER